MNTNGATVLPIRSPPHNIQAELALLGACMFDRSVVDDVSLVISGDDFWRDAHSRIWLAIERLNAAGQPTDPVAVRSRLLDSGDWEDIDGMSIFAEIEAATPHAVNGPYLAQVIRQLSTKRQLIRIGAEISQAGYERGKGAGEALEEAERKIYQIADRQTKDTNTEAATFIGNAMTIIQSRSQNEPRGLMTGFDELDFVIDGLKPDDFVVMAARPSQGKTALAMSVASRASLYHQASVLFFSMEMSELSLSERLLSAWSNVDSMLLKRSWQMTDKHRANLNDAAIGLSSTKLALNDGAFPTVSEIASHARRTKSRKGLDLIVIDYLALINMQRQKGENRQEEVARTSRRLKATARELGVPVLCLHQLNRQSEQREDKRPRMADLRESGQVEQDADVVLLIHRPEYYDPNDQPGVAEIIVAKNRNGPTGTVKLMFRKQCTRFDSMPEHVPAAAY